MSEKEKEKKKKESKYEHLLLDAMQDGKCMKKQCNHPEKKKCTQTWDVPVELHNPKRRKLRNLSLNQPILKKSNKIFQIWIARRINSQSELTLFKLRLPVTVNRQAFLARHFAG